MNRRSPSNILQLAIFLGLFFSVPLAYAALKTWSSTETIQSVDLNANFQTVNTAATALITNAKVDASAAISHSKLATPALVPKAWAVVESTCSTGTCTLGASSGVTSIVYVSAGLYTITWGTARADAHYAVFVTPITPLELFCNAYLINTTTAGVYCHDASAVAANAAFQILMMDNL